jgi:hypothetical protein
MMGACLSAHAFGSAVSTRFALNRVVKRKSDTKMRDRSSTGRGADTGARPDGTRAAAPEARLVLRRCRVCEWSGELVEAPGADPDCPWCHGPTAAEAATAVPTEAADTGAPGGKNPHAAALGRLGGIKGGRARAQRLSAKRRREIALNAARTRWKK